MEFTLPFRVTRTRRHVERRQPCLLLEAETGHTISSHPTLESAVAEAKRIAAYRVARKLEPLATIIIAR